MAGWTWTWQLPRADFDKVLADEVANRGVPIRYAAAVTGVDFQGDHATATVESAEGEYRIRARFVIDASGYGRVLPRLLQLEAPAPLPPRQALFTHVEDTNRPTGTEGTLITFVVPEQTLWFWVIPFSNGITSLGFVGDTSHFKEIKGTTTEQWRTLLPKMPYYRKRFAEAPIIFEPKTITAYSKSIQQLWGPGFALTGNSAEFLDPVFSSGVAFATESGALAARLVSRQLAGEAVDWERDFSAHIRHGVDVFRTYVNAWYDGSLQDIFFALNINPDIKRQICSVLAGYVWDHNNPFVSKHHRILKALGEVVRIEAKKRE